MKAAFWVAPLLWIVGISTAAHAIDLPVPLDSIGHQFFDRLAPKLKGKVDDLKYDGVTPDLVCNDKGDQIPCVAVFSDFKIDVGNNTVYVLLHTDLIPSLQNGVLKLESRTEIADLRIKEGGWAPWAEKAIQGCSLGQADLDVAQVICDIVRGKIVDSVQGMDEKIKEAMSKSTPQQGVISDLKITRDSMIATVFGQGNGFAKRDFSVMDMIRANTVTPGHPIKEWGNPETAEVVLVLFFDNLQLHTIASVNNGDPTKFGDDHLKEWTSEDFGNPGQNRIVIYLRHGEKLDFLQQLFGGTNKKWNDWHKKPGSFILLPGPKWDERTKVPQLRLWNGHDSENFGIGDHSLQLQQKNLFRSVDGAELLD